MRPSAVLMLSALALAGCVTPEGAPQLVASVDSLDFGAVPVESEALATVELSNAGGGVVELFSVTLVEGASSTWQVDRDPATQIAGREALTLSVTFAPQDEGDARGRIQIRSDDPTTPSLFVALSGSGGASIRDDDADGYTRAEGDCDDEDPDSYPGADELCDGADNDCDGSLPADEADADYDGWRPCEGDCDDTLETAWPGAPEVCDEADSDCDGTNPDQADQDGDGASICEGDCADLDDRVQPGAEELCDGLDNDCAGGIDDIDLDGDGRSPCGPAGDCDDEDPTSFPLVVDPSAPEGGDGSDEAPFDTLPAALAAVNPECRRIGVAEGDYVLSETLAGVEVEITGAGTSRTTLSSPEDSRVLEIDAGSRITLREMTVQGGSASSDGGAIRVQDSELILTDIVFRENHSGGDGGAIAVVSGSLWMAPGVVFEDNSATDDGGALALSASTLTDIGGAVFRGNSAVRGGALYAQGGALVLEDTVLVDNHAGEVGGAGVLVGGVGHSWIGGLVGANSAGSSAGGLALFDVVDTGSAWRNIVFADNDGGAEAGGLHITGSAAALLLANCTFVGNSATGDGGGLLIDATSAADLSVRSNVVGWSVALSGVYVDEASLAQVSHNSVFFSSAADWAGADLVDVDENRVEDPRFVDWNDNGDPEDDDLGLAGDSPLRDSGPVESEWNDPDGTRNDRGATGGPFAP